MVVGQSLQEHQPILQCYLLQWNISLQTSWNFPLNVIQVSMFIQFSCQHTWIIYLINSNNRVIKHTFFIVSLINHIYGMTSMCVISLFLKIKSAMKIWKIAPKSWCNQSIEMFSFYTPEHCMCCYSTWYIPDLFSTVAQHIQRIFFSISHNWHEFSWRFPRFACSSCHNHSCRWESHCKCKIRNFCGNWHTRDYNCEVV